MAGKAGTQGELSEHIELLRKMLIVQLGLESVPQGDIRAIVGCSSALVTDTLKPLHPKGARARSGGN